MALPTVENVRAPRKFINSRSWMVGFRFLSSFMIFFIYSIVF
jgi:hypothetical protein